MEHTSWFVLLSTPRMETDWAIINRCKLEYLSVASKLAALNTQSKQQATTTTQRKLSCR
jgi:hypothetical protein